jgi:two-component system, chemotaxis family, protein-glutamate methylesterase/glutaminase
MAGIRVLVVDDSVVIRKVLNEALASDPEIEVVGTAAGGNIALSKIPLVNPDLITLDVEMPGMSGLETLIAIRQLYPKLPVIMFSTLTERGAATTLEALSLGASDCVTKPQGSRSVEETRTRIRSAGGGPGIKASATAARGGLRRECGQPAKCTCTL